MISIAVLCSGNGTNLQAIIDNVKSGYIPAEIALVVSDNDGAHALTRAKKANIEILVLNPEEFESRDDYDKAIIKELKNKNIGLVALAGFMRILSPALVRAYENKIMNIHPALLPAFRGTHGIKDAFEHGVKQTGVTVHFVDEKLDNGPIIMQEALIVNEEDTLDSLEKKIHELEHRLYPEAIRLFVEGKLRIDGRKVRIKK